MSLKLRSSLYKKIRAVAAVSYSYRSGEWSEPRSREREGIAKPPAFQNWIGFLFSALWAKGRELQIQKQLRRRRKLSRNVMSSSVLTIFEESHFSTQVALGEDEYPPSERRNCGSVCSSHQCSPTGCESFISCYFCVRLPA